MIGFVDLGNVNLNYATLQETNAIASHVLDFLLRNVVTPFKFSLANLENKNATAIQIFTLFWKAVAVFKTRCAIKGIAATFDGASANHKFFRVHFGITHDDELNGDTDVVFRTINFLSEDKRSFLTHQIYLKLHIIVLIILDPKRVLVLCEMVVSF